MIAAPALRYWRWSVPVSQNELAGATGVPVSTIQRLERGQRSSAEVLARLTRFLEQERATQVAQIAQRLTDFPDQDVDTPLDLTQPLTPEQQAWLEGQS